MKKANRDLINAVCECATNVLDGRVPLSGGQKRRLVKHKTKLRELANKKVGLKKKRRILQTGRFLGALLAPALSFLGGLILPKIFSSGGASQQ